MVKGTSVGKGGGETAMNHVLQENLPSLKEVVLLAPAIKLFNSLGTFRGKFKPLWKQRRKIVAGDMLIKKSKQEKQC